MADSEIEFLGVNHVALVSSDMARTVEFYRDILGMPLIKTIEIPGGSQHFFFDCGSGNSIAFFWFPDAPAHSPGVASSSNLPGEAGNGTSAHGSLNHLAFNVAIDKFDECVERLQAKGIAISPVLNHDDSELTIAADLHPGVFVRSVYFRDPDGVMLELACWTRELGPQDALDLPKNAAGDRVQLA